MKSRAKKKPQSSADAPVLSKEGVPLARVRRAPNPVAFLITGGLLGVVLGLVLSTLGDNGSYQPSSVSGYFMVLFGALGVLLGGVVFALLDRRS